MVNIYSHVVSSYIAVAIESNDGDKNMLRKEMADTVNNFLRHVQTNMTIELDGVDMDFGSDICPRLALCPISNTIVQIFYDTYFSEKVSCWFGDSVFLLYF